MMALGNQLGDTSISDIIGQATSVIQQSSQYLPTIQMVLNDPALPGIIQRVDTILAIPTAPSSTPGTAPTAPVGLQQFYPYLDAYIFWKQNPVLTPLAVAAGVLLIGAVGYKLGKKKRSTT